jgi:hypothetical protein
MMRPYASTFACGGTASPISYSRWVWRVRMSLESSELYFYSSRRVGKPLYIDMPTEYYNCPSMPQLTQAKSGNAVLMNANNLVNGFGYKIYNDQC